VLIRVVLKTTPARQYEISRLVRERVKAAFDEEGIEIPMPKLVTQDSVSAVPPAR
jgi:small conductance mechanosensitive channel